MTTAVGTPAHDGTVFPKGETVAKDNRSGNPNGPVTPGRNRHEVVPLRRCCLTVVVHTPADYGAIGLQSQTVFFASINGNKIAATRWRGLAYHVPAPASDSAIGFEG